MLPTLLLAALLATSTNAAAIRRRDEGCKSLSDDSQVYQFDGDSKLTTREVNGRKYLVNLPSRYQEQTRHAVVLSFHGNGGSAENQMRLSQLSDQGVLINGAGIISVFPQALPGDGSSAAWQGAPYAQSDDIDFTNTILDELTENLCVDSSRIYASGKSNGGGFVNLLACTQSTSSRLAGYALVSAALYPDTLVNSDDCHPAFQQTPIFISHGDSDGTIPYTGREVQDGEDPNRYTPDIDDVASFWAERNGFGGDDYESARPHDDVDERAWPNVDGAQVIRYKVEGLGHSWPTTDGLDGSGAPNNYASFDLTKPDLIDFFGRWSLPSDESSGQLQKGGVEPSWFSNGNAAWKA